MTGKVIPVEERVLEVLGQLGIPRAHFAVRAWDWLGLVSTRPDIIASLTLIGTDQGEPSHLARLADRLLLIYGDLGPFGTAARGLADALPEAKKHLIGGYLVLPWSDIIVEQRQQVGDAMFRFLERQPPLPAIEGAHMEGQIAGVRYAITGSGPPLVLFPLNLAPSQWEPLIPELSTRFRVIKLTGPHLGIAPMLETRGATPGYMDMLGRVMDSAGLAPGECVLEVGVGTGAVSRWLARRTEARNPITGLDVNCYLLEEAAALVHDDGFESVIDLRQGDGLDLPFDDASFDLTMAITMLEEVDAELGLSELIRVTKPGGRVAVVVRAIDVNWVVGLPLPPGLKATVEAAAGGVGPGGCADGTLYERFHRHGLRDLSFFPYLVTFNRPELGVGLYVQRNLFQKLPREEHPVLGAAIGKAAAEGTFMVAQPHHCAIGTKTRAV